MHACHDRHAGLGVLTLRPALQGAFDGLCGVYAVMNSLDPAGLRRSRSKLHRDLFVQLTHSLPASKLRAAMREGLTANDLQRASRIAFAWLSDAYGIDLKLERPFQRRHFQAPGDYLDALSEIHDASGCGIIISFQTSSWAHWTVVSRVAPHSLLLRDSIGWREIKKSKFLDGKYHARPADTLILRASTACHG